MGELPLVCRFSFYELRLQGHGMSQICRRRAVPFALETFAMSGGVE
jgi:hypothetical protein